MQRRRRATDGDRLAPAERDRIRLDAVAEDDGPVTELAAHPENLGRVEQAGRQRRPRGRARPRLADEPGERAVVRRGQRDALFALAVDARSPAGCAGAGRNDDAGGGLALADAVDDELV